MKLIPIALYLFIINIFLQETSVRKKFLYFLIIFTSFVLLGICLNLDGIILLFIVSEIAVLLIFIIIFSQLKSFSSKTHKKKGFLLFLFCALSLNYTIYDSNITSYKSFYNQQIFQLNDFFYIFNYFFEKQSIITILVIIFITLYSLFFIILYFCIKQIILKETHSNSKIFALRKQNILKQSIYSTKIRFFKK